MRLARREVRVPLLGEGRALGDVEEHVGRPRRAAVQTRVAVRAGVRGYLLEDVVHGGEDRGHDGRGARMRRVSAVGETVGKVKVVGGGVFHHRRDATSGGGVAIFAVPSRKMKLWFPLIQSRKLAPDWIDVDGT